MMIIAMMRTALPCEVSMEQVWECAAKHDRHNRGCLTATDIHTAQMKHGNLLSRSKLLSHEGAKYHRLFKDCSGTRKLCIIPSQAKEKRSCQRSCEWRKNWVQTMCI
mgnify:CR=1 FL=1